MVEAVVIGLWAYIFATILVHPKELLGWYGRAVNRALTGLDGPPDPATLRGWRLFLYKYTYCPVCLAGLLSLGYSLATDPVSFFYNGALSIITAHLLTSYGKRQ